MGCANPKRCSLTDWVTPVRSAFKGTDAVMRGYVECHERAYERNFSLEHFCLYRNNELVTSATLSRHNDSVRLDDLETIEEMQGQGCASQLMRCILEEARLRGARFCVLESSASGLRLHEKLGFKKLQRRFIYQRVLNNSK